MIKLKKKSATVFKGLDFLVVGGGFLFCFVFVFLMNEHVSKTLQSLNHFTANSHFSAAVHLFEFYLL